MGTGRQRRRRYGGEYGEDELSPRDVRQLGRSLRRTEQHALAHAVATALTDYRWSHELSQQQLAEVLDVKQPQVARLESGLVNPSIDTLRRLSERLELDFTIEVKSGRVSAGATPRGSRRA